MSEYVHIDELFKYRDEIKDKVPVKDIPGYDMYWGYGFSYGVEGNDRMDLLVKHILSCKEKGINSSYSWYNNQLHIRESVSKKGFNNPEEIELKKEEWNNRLKSVCEKYNLEYKKPGWMFVGYVFGIHKDDIEKAEKIILEQNL